MSLYPKKHSLLMPTLFMVSLLISIGCDEAATDDPSLIISTSYPDTICDGLLISNEHFDFLQGDPNSEYLIGETRCEYDEESRPLRELTFDYLQGSSNREYLIAEKRFSWTETTVTVEIIDYLQGEPNQEYVIGRHEVQFQP